MAETMFRIVSRADILDESAQKIGPNVARFIGAVSGQTVHKLDGQTVKNSIVLPLSSARGYGLSLFGLVVKRGIGPWVMPSKQRLSRLSYKRVANILNQFEALVRHNNQLMASIHGPGANQIDWIKPIP